MAAPQVIDAPWQLQGQGYLFLYRFSKPWLDKHGAVPEPLMANFVGGLGAVMLVDYQTGSAKPYRELLIIPGKFQFGSVRRHCITRILVSTEQSVLSGRHNWGIPKELAEFSITDIGPRKQRFDVCQGNSALLSAELSYGRLPLPLHTALIPMPLAQPWKQQLMLTDYRGRGMGRLATMDVMSVDKHRFADLSQCKPLLGMRAAPFNIDFPIADIMPWKGYGLDQSVADNGPTNAEQITRRLG